MLQQYEQLKSRIFPFTQKIFLLLGNDFLGLISNQTKDKLEYVGAQFVQVTNKSCAELLQQMPSLFSDSNVPIVLVFLHI